MAKGKNQDRIKIDDLTRENLMALTARRREIDLQIQLILGTYLNAVGVKGEYRLSDDCSELMRVKDVK